MTGAVQKKFNWRAFWSLLLAVTVVGLAWSGIQNHELGFDGMTVERHAWMSAHNVLAVLFVIAAVAHAVLNGKALLRHARGLAARLPSREAVVALALTAGLLFLFVGHAQVAGDRGGPGQGTERGGVHGAR
jgi:hypothetical protein